METIEKRKFGRGIKIVNSEILFDCLKSRKLKIGNSVQKKPPEESGGMFS